MFKKGLIFFGGCFLLSFLLIGAGPSQAKTIDLTYSTFFPATHTHTLLSIEWGKEIEKRTKGAVKVTMFPGATLTPANQSYDGVVKGGAQVLLAASVFHFRTFRIREVKEYLRNRGLQVNL